jgi:hypothetical protein
MAENADGDPNQQELCQKWHTFRAFPDSPVITFN